MRRKITFIKQISLLTLQTANEQTSDAGLFRVTVGYGSMFHVKS